MDNRHLIAAEGMLLTNGEVYAVEVWLGDGDSTYNWQEITQEEAEALQVQLLDDHEIE